MKKLAIILLATFFIQTSYGMGKGKVSTKIISQEPLIIITQKIDTNGSKSFSFFANSSSIDGNHRSIYLTTNENGKISTNIQESYQAGLLKFFKNLENLNNISEKFNREFPSILKYPSILKSPSLLKGNSVKLFNT